jgi:DNA replication and repair protein RecF
MALRAEPRGAADTTLEVTSLTLEDFRNYGRAELRPAAGLTVIVAPNGAGKTNLLEAISVAITGRSHRASSDTELVREGQPFGRIRVELAGGTNARGATIEVVLPGTQPPIGVRKRLTVNGVPRRVGALGELARAVLFRPEEMLLLVGSPSDRRRFLDGILAQRSRTSARDLVDLARVVAQRNALLRAIRAEEASLDAMAFWDEQLAVVGARVMQARLEVVAELGRRIGSLHDAVAPPDERGSRVELSYVDALKESWPERAEAADRVPSEGELARAYRRRISDVRPKEAWNGVSLVGPQRDDLRVALGGRDVALHASRGQQRTIILALKLAETDLLGASGPRPVVLLDDVFSELDPERAERLSGLLGTRGQVIVTTADPASVVAVDGDAPSVWGISGGALRPLA